MERLNAKTEAYVVVARDRIADALEWVARRVRGQRLEFQDYLEEVSREGIPPTGIEIQETLPPGAVR